MISNNDFHGYSFQLGNGKHYITTCAMQCYVVLTFKAQEKEKKEHVNFACIDALFNTQE